MEKTLYYLTKKDNTLRFSLGEEGKNPIICMGVNPSTATIEKYDRTIKTVKEISNRHNYDGWIMINISPQRATNPNDISQNSNQEMHSDNLKIIEKIFKIFQEEEKPIIIWAAWGNLITKRSYLKKYLQDIYNLSKKYKVDWKYYGTLTKKGNPRHPSRVSYQEAFSPFNVDKYLNSNEITIV